MGVILGGFPFQREGNPPYFFDQKNHQQLQKFVNFMQDLLQSLQERSLVHPQSILCCFPVNVDVKEAAVCATQQLLY